LVLVKVKNAFESKHFKKALSNKKALANWRQAMMSQLPNHRRKLPGGGSCYLLDNCFF
jgi:hypothetical protein